MSDRTSRFNNLALHPMLGRDFKKLTLSEVLECHALLESLSDLDDQSFLLRLNRWKMDQPEKRSKRHAIQWGLLSQSVETQCNRRTK